MRNTLRLTILAMLFLAAGCSHYDRELMGEPQPQAQPNVANSQPLPENAPVDSDSMDIGMFHDLDYYGQWYQRDPYGWVWRPSVVMNWQPFMHGHWIWSQYGWMWVDYDPWGWATSHYGYWYNDFTLGWVWIPDYTWSPVQCDWLVYGDYIGWCPEAPPGAAFRDPWDDSTPWVFVPVRKFKQADVAVNRATPKFKTVNNDIMRGKPALQDVERKGAGLFPQVDVQLDRRVVRDREFAKVKYPPDQQDIIASHRTVPIKSGGTQTNMAPVQYSPGSPYSPGTPGPPPPIVGPVQPGPQQPPAQAKSKGSSPPPAPAKTETKYKSQKAQEKKDSGKSKDPTTTKKGKG
jgi:hypothetical protein